MTAPENDWMEWQAAYISGALLMPRSYVLVMAGEIAMRDGSKFPLDIDSEPGRAVIARIMQALPCLRTGRTGPAPAFGPADRIVKSVRYNEIMEFDNYATIELWSV